MRELLDGNSAVVKAAMLAGLNGFFGYPITPSTEILEGFAEIYNNDIEREKDELPRFYPDFHFVQMESEIAAINAVRGGACSGKRVMTATSGPGLSLMQEGISFIAASMIPAVIVDVMRCGPGLGSVDPEQSDYNAVVKCGGHGDYKVVTLAPNSVREVASLTMDAFNIADKYRTLVAILMDASLGHTIEAIEFPERKIEAVEHNSWAVKGRGYHKDKTNHVIKTLFLDKEEMRVHKNVIRNQYNKLENELVMYDEFMTDDAETVLLAYGTPSMIAKEAVLKARSCNLKVGLFRPITLWPFPKKRLEGLVANRFIVVEQSFGQFYDDVRLALYDRKDASIELLDCYGGYLPSVSEVLKRL